jgi:hypothetical protein
MREAPRPIEILREFDSHAASTWPVLESSSRRPRSSLIIEAGGLAEEFGGVLSSTHPYSSFDPPTSVCDSVKELRDPVELMRLSSRLRCPAAGSVVNPGVRAQNPDAQHAGWWKGGTTERAGGDG